MKKAIFVLLAFTGLTAFTTFTGTWANDDPHSQLGFTVTHLGIADVSGTFNDIDVTVNASKPDFSDARFELTARTSSIDTRVDARNNHLKSADFFDVEKFPTMTFKSTKLKKAGKNKYKMYGDLSLHGVTRPVVLNVAYKGSVENPMSKKQTVGFQVTGVIKRSDFNVGSGFPTAVISDEVRIKADGEFVQ
ncbi:MAG: polyisoprenoid-binding protein [Chitinophagaceae bacterium]|nr:MAG: polyisoprenoid-binding protein [Chitinophagaceae bacterium]